MRFLVRATIPNEAGNDMLRDPEFGKRMEAVMAALKPEAAYFLAENGQRTMYLVLSMTDSSQLAHIGETLWLGLEADVEAMPVMNQDDFAKAMATIGETVRKFG